MSVLPLFIIRDNVWRLVSSQIRHKLIEFLFQSVGIGKLRTNTVLMGFKRDWREDTTEKLMGYIDIIQWVYFLSIFSYSFAAFTPLVTRIILFSSRSDAFDLNYGVCILRLKEGLDVSPYLQDTQGACRWYDVIIGDATVDIRSSFKCAASC